MNCPAYWKPIGSSWRLVCVREQGHLNLHRDANDIEWRHMSGDVSVIDEHVLTRLNGEVARLQNVGRERDERIRELNDRLDCANRENVKLINEISVLCNSEDAEAALVECERDEYLYRLVRQVRRNTKLKLRIKKLKRKVGKR